MKDDKIILFLYALFFLGGNSCVIMGFVFESLYIFIYGVFSVLLYLLAFLLLSFFLIIVNIVNILINRNFFTSRILGNKIFQRIGVSLFLFILINFLIVLGMYPLALYDVKEYVKNAEGIDYNPQIHLTLFAIPCFRNLIIFEFEIENFTNEYMDRPSRLTWTAKPWRCFEEKLD